VRLERAQFLAALSHELRTPLNSILGFTQVLLSGLDGPLSAGQQEDLEAIASAGDYLSTLVREVLDTSAETTGELEVFGPMDLGAIARDAALFFEPQARKTGHAITVVGAEAPRPLGSARAVRQVLLNLIGNATKHGRPGPVRIEARARGDVAALAVTNAGRTVLSAREAPFAAFERGEQDGRGTDPEGWGLGLAIADELAARMGGAIEMRSEQGHEGPETTFALLLPLARGVRLREGASQVSMPTRTHFVAAMSHELRAPLGSIAGFASLLEDEGEGPLTPAQRQSVVRIRRSAESLVASLTDILDVARADVGRLKLSPGRIDGGALAADVLAGASHLVEDREPTCSLSLDLSGLAALGLVHVDARRVVQASLGLLRHGLRAGAPTLLELSRREDDRAVRSLRIAVRDPSRITEPAEAEASFDPFRALVDPSGRRILGMGLALALARTIARLHGGDAWCETVHGTTWVLAIPFGA